MIEPQALEAMSEEQILDAAGSCAEAIRDAEADLLRLAYQWAIVHQADPPGPGRGDQARP